MSSATLEEAPGQTVLTFEVLGRPAPKGSRIQKRARSGKVYTYPASQYEYPWIAAVKAQAENYVRYGQLAPPYRVELSFRIQAPKYRGARVGTYPTVPDLDKLVRSTIDGLVKGKALSDDRHVTEIMARKRYTNGSTEPGVEVRVISLQSDQS